MAQKVKFKRKTTSEIDNLEIEDGSLIYNVENGKTYMDYGNNRIPTGGGANGGIYVGDTEPTDPDITLWVDTPITETKASEIVDEYTESDKVGYSCDYINDAFVYSTNEVKTGKKWIDGKPIYRKTISYSGSALGAYTNLPHGVSNIGEHRIIVEQAYIYNGNSFIGYSNGTEFANVIVIDGTNVGVAVGSGWSTLFTKAYITIEYTKTTD